MERQKAGDGAIHERRSSDQNMWREFRTMHDRKRSETRLPLSPLLFTVYVESMMREAYWESEEGIKLGGQLLRDIRFADDKGMVGSSKNELQSIMDKLSGKAAEYDMKINAKKTKVMVVSKKGGVTADIVVDGQPVEQVKQFKWAPGLQKMEETW